MPDSKLILNYVLTSNLKKPVSPLASYKQLCSYEDQMLHTLKGAIISSLDELRGDLGPFGRSYGGIQILAIFKKSFRSCRLAFMMDKVA